MGLFSRKKKNGPSKVKKGAQEPMSPEPTKPQWEDAWSRTTVEPEEVRELCQLCTLEIKSRALDMPFLLLPFRPTSDPSASRTFIRHFFERGQGLYGEALAQELRLTEPMVLCGVIKWCWSRLAGGVVGWDAYELFRVGEQDSNMARDSFATFIPLSVDSDARTHIIFDFFDLLSAISAHAKSNGLGGRKLSRLAGWWAFEHVDVGNGFEGGYKGWAKAADATSHLFFAYLRSLSPDSVKGINGISTLPMSLQKLLQETEYPPERPSLMQSTTTKVVMIVNSVSPTPFALLRRANNFQYRDDDRALQEFSEYEDPVKALTDECRRVLRSISSANQSQASSSKQSTGLRDASWSRFEDIGFSGGFDENEEEEGEGNFVKQRKPQGLRTTPHARNVGLGRPTTPSWADFLSSGFVDESTNGPAPLLLPPDKILPPIDTSRGRSSQSHSPRLEHTQNLEPGELANITRFDLDDAFWWVWISSLAGEEPAERKAAFGRCALVETVIAGGRWLVMEEIIQGAAPTPDPGAYIAEKKSRFGWTKRNKGVSRSKSTATGKPVKEQQTNGRPSFQTSQSVGVSKTSIGPDQHARIQAAAIQLQQKQRMQELEREREREQGMRRGRNQMDAMSQKTASVFTLQPVIMSEASPAMKWANRYDKDAIREAYLGKQSTGPRGLGKATMQTNGQPSRSRSRERGLPTIPSSAGSDQEPSGGRTPEPAPFPPTPADVPEQDQHHELSEKAADLPLPRDAYPRARKPVVSPMPSPMPRGKASSELPRGPSTELSESSPESKKHNKLKKEKPQGGFRKMFGRKKKSPAPQKAPPVEPENNGQLQAGGATLGRRFSGFRKKSPVNSPTAENVPGFAPVARPISEDGDITPIASPNQHYDRSYDPSVRDSLSRVDTHDADEAHEEFSRFDQGPMDDVPSFVPEDSPRPSEDAMPPPISKARGGEDDDSAELTKPASPSQDRWARIRKNAADRAAQRQSEEQSRGGNSQKTDGEDGETSGEETIESRVARIKARVAELTGNMEAGAPAPGSRSPPVRR